MRITDEGKADALASLGLDGATMEALDGAVAALHRWYESEARDLPWRRTRDPYAIWVSEAMLQQTQVATVIPYFERWMRRFPTVSALADADEADVLVCWEGLGYYRRARLLHAAAREVASRYAGVVPRELEAFRALPGVGEYTAAAVASIAFDQDEPVLDGNVQRVLARLVRLEIPPARAPGRRSLLALAGRLLPAGTARLHNQAVMELGARICTPRKPTCAVCPLAEPCAARTAEDVERYPLKVPRKAVPHRHLAVAVVRDDQERLLLYKRPYGGMLAGLWDLPAVELEERAAAADLLLRVVRERYGLKAATVRALPLVRHAYTHLKVTLHPWLMRAPARAELSAAEAGTELRWVEPGRLGELALPRAGHKVLESLDDGAGGAI